MTEASGGTDNARDWRKALTKDERAELREVERAIKRGDKEIRNLRAARRKIQNRATRRAGYAEAAKAGKLKLKKRRGDTGAKSKP